jgi:hypothetical protein
MFPAPVIDTRSETISLRIMPRQKLIAPAPVIETKIHLVRGQKVMLDSDLAEMYEVPTKRLNEAVRRNLDRFPEDFSFLLTIQEVESLRSQIATSKTGRGGRRYMPRAFTEHGIAMLSAVLHSERAVQVSIFIVRTFVRLREVIAAHKDLAARVEKLESGHTDHASIITVLVKEIRALKILPEPPRNPIGFRIRKRDD